jgi:hypothetical protein
VRHYRVGRGVIETEFGSLKVPRQCPPVLLVKARRVFGICSILIFKDVGAAVVGLCSLTLGGLYYGEKF